MQTLKRKIQVTLAGLLVVFGLVVFTPALAGPVFADSKSEAEAGITATGAAPGGLTVQDLIRNIVLILSYLVGAIAVIMLIVGGFMYVTSQGDAGRLTTARNTIVYALVGIVVVLFAQVVVRYVVVIATQ